MFTDLNIYPINNKTDHISEKYIFYRKKVTQDMIFSRFQVGFGAGFGSFFFIILFFYIIKFCQLYPNPIIKTVWICLVDLELEGIDIQGYLAKLVSGTTLILLLFTQVNFKTNLSPIELFCHVHPGKQHTSIS